MEVVETVEAVEIVEAAEIVEVVEIVEAVEIVEVAEIVVVNKQTKMLPVFKFSLVRTAECDFVNKVLPCRLAVRPEYMAGRL